MLRKLAGIAFAILCIVGIVAGLAVLRFDEHTARAAIEDGFARTSGRPWRLDGDVRFVPGLRPSVVAHGLMSPNADWARETEFVSIGTLQLDTDWVSVLGGNPAVSAIRITDVELNLETDGDGANNWQAPAGPAGAGAASAFPLDTLGRVDVSDTLVRFRSGWADAETSYPVHAIALEFRGADVPVSLSVDAEVKGQPLSIDGQLGSPAAMSAGHPFEVALSGRYSGRESNADVLVDGRIARLGGLEGLNVKFTLKADSLNEVGSISGFELPRDTPVSITAALVNRGAGPELADYVLRIGQAILRPSE